MSRAAKLTSGGGGSDKDDTKSDDSGNGGGGGGGGILGGVRDKVGDAVDKITGDDGGGSGSSGGGSGGFLNTIENKVSKARDAAEQRADETTDAAADTAQAVEDATQVDEAAARAVESAAEGDISGVGDAAAGSVDETVSQIGDRAGDAAQQTIDEQQRRADQAVRDLSGGNVGVSQDFTKADPSAVAEAASTAIEPAVEAGAKTQRKRATEGEQFGDIDWSFGLGGPNDEVEQAAEALPRETRSRLEPVGDRTFGDPEKYQSTGEAIADWAGREQLGDQYDRGLRRFGSDLISEPPAAIASLPKAGLEAAELGVEFSTDPGGTAKDLPGGVAAAGVGLKQGIEEKPSQTTAGLLGGAGLGRGLGKTVGKTRVGRGRSGKALRTADVDPGKQLRDLLADERGRITAPTRRRTRSKREFPEQRQKQKQKQRSREDDLSPTERAERALEDESRSDGPEMIGDESLRQARIQDYRNMRDLSLDEARQRVKNDPILKEGDATKIATESSAADAAAGAQGGSGSVLSGVGGFGGSASFSESGLAPDPSGGQQGLNPFDAIEGSIDGIIGAGYPEIPEITESGNAAKSQQSQPTPPVFDDPAQEDVEQGQSQEADLLDPTPDPDPDPDPGPERSIQTTPSPDPRPDPDPDPDPQPTRSFQPTPDPDPYPRPDRLLDPGPDPDPDPKPDDNDRDDDPLAFGPPAGGPFAIPFQNPIASGSEVLFGGPGGPREGEPAPGTSEEIESIRDELDRREREDELGRIL